MDNNMQVLSAEISKLKAGNFNDYKNFYDITAPYIYKVITDIVKDPDASATVNSNVYNRIYKTINQLTDDNYFYQWAEAIAKEESFNYLNQSKPVVVPAVGISSGEGAVAGAIGGSPSGVSGTVAAGAMETSGVGVTGSMSAGTMGGSGVTGSMSAGAMGGPGATGSMSAGALGGETAGVGVAAGVAAKAGLGIGAKIAIAVAGAAVLVGGGIGIFLMANKDKDDKEEKTTVETTTEEMTTVAAATTTDAETTEEVIELEDSELLSLYYEETVVPALGMSDGTAQSGQVASSYMDYDNKMAWINIDAVNGIVAHIIDDFDGDGSDEMAVFYMAEVENPSEIKWDNAAGGFVDVPYSGRASGLRYDIYAVVNGEVALTDTNDFSILSFTTDNQNVRLRDTVFPSVIFDNDGNGEKLFVSYTTDDNGNKRFLLEHRDLGGLGNTDVCNYHRVAFLHVADDKLVADGYIKSNAMHQGMGEILAVKYSNGAASEVITYPTTGTAYDDSYEKNGYAVWRSFVDEMGFASGKCVAWSAIGFDYEHSETDSILSTNLDANMLFIINAYSVDEGDWQTTPCIWGYDMKSVTE